MLRVKQIAGILVNVAIFTVLLLGPAGTLAWPRAWLLLGVIAVAGAIAIAVIPEDLLHERYKLPIQHGQPAADKVVVVALLLTFLGTVAFIPLDVFRFHLLPPPSPALSWVGLVMFAAGWWLMVAAMVANRFAALVVRHQEERHQHVVDSGPYRVVRHPMYSAIMPLTIGMALWLGSYAAAIAALVPTGVIVIRLLLEERFLRRELAGYAAYTTRTPYRLIPFVW
jgi:protein-S-isoprenylcysteine O-methyltransferase Ste14